MTDNPKSPVEALYQASNDFAKYIEEIADEVLQEAKDNHAEAKSLADTLRRAIAQHAQKTNAFVQRVAGTTKALPTNSKQASLEAVESELRKLQ